VQHYQVDSEHKHAQTHIDLYFF